MLIIPAVDIMDGKCVQLFQGRADRQTVYSDRPADMARRWRDQGAEYLHVVDLDGAFEGAPRNMNIVEKIVKAVDIPVELGGGMRSLEIAESALDAGVSRVIIGTKACEPQFLAELLQALGEKAVIGIDAKDGMVSTHGWEEVTSIPALEFARQVEKAGGKTIVYTDISRDGALEGPNLEAATSMLQAVTMDVIASGGVTTIEDIRSLAGLSPRKPAGVIIGTALYDGRIDLHEALEAAESC